MFIVDICCFSFCWEWFLLMEHERDSRLLLYKSNLYKLHCILLLPRSRAQNGKNIFFVFLIVPFCAEKSSSQVASVCVEDQEFHSSNASSLLYQLLFSCWLNLVTLLKVVFLVIFCFYKYPLSITLQVVKKAGPGTDVSVSDSWPVSGTKRSVRDRLGSSSDSDLFYGSQLNNKRYVVLSFYFLSAALS